MEAEAGFDRFLICQGWLSSIPEVCQTALQHSVPDHYPILLDPRLESWGTSPFIFEIAWLEILKMEEKLGNWWKEHRVSGLADVAIGSKLRYVKSKLKIWKKENERVWGERKAWLLVRIKEIVGKKLEGQAYAVEVEEAGRRKEEHNRLMLQVEISWCQKSRVKRLKGDKNTAYFHPMAVLRRRGNRIEALQVNAAMIDNKEAIIKEIMEYYKKLYSSEGDDRPIPEGMEFGCLEEEDRRELK
ncbi:uncharacterized protein LOC143878986 [Tasmannia lanceolata]|uniref:uncharacterized protein LOC143878986 n=1 Tax=Tasmannia lanceolata TaxID=3420 RepID=UPI0040634B38